MNSEQRDRFLRMILPALLIGIIYHFGFSKQSELDAAREALEGAERAAVDDFAVQQARLDAAKSASELSSVEKEKTDMDDRWTRLTSFSDTSPARRAAALRRLSQMLWDRGLYPFEESPPDNDGALPGSFDDVLAKLNEKKPAATGSAKDRLWKIRFYGRYSDVVDALWSIGESDLELVPVGLQMSETKADTPWRSWTLLLWN